MVESARVPQAFRPEQRLHERKQFLTSYDKGSRHPGRLMTVFVSPNALPVSRLGVSATRRFGGAVARNLAKRRLREAFRQHVAPHLQGVDLVVIPKQDLLTAAFPDVVDELDRLARKPPRLRARSQS